jgi:hypothetical protein
MEGLARFIAYMDSAYARLPPSDILKDGHAPRHGAA